MADILIEENKSLSLIRTITLVAGAHIVMALTDGATSSFGIFLTDFAGELNVGLRVIGAASSLLTSVLHLFSPVGAYIATKLGYRRTIVIGTLMISVGLMLSSQVREPWQLFFSHSLVTGIGMTLMYTNVIAFVGLACDKHISIANGVVAAGTAAGWITIPLLINVLREIYGWRGALLLLGAIVFHATVLSLVLFRSPSAKLKLETGKSEYSKEILDDGNFMELRCDEVEDTKENSQEIKSNAALLMVYLQLPLTYPLFGFLIIVANLMFLGYAGTLFHLVASAIKRGIPETKAMLLMTVYGIGNIISRLLHGVPIKLKLITSQNLFVIALIVAGVSTYLLPFCETYEGIVSGTFFIGLSTGTCVPLVFLCTREIVGIKDFPKALGMVMLTTGLAGVTGGFFTGWIYDFFGSYNTAFFVIGSFFFTGCAFMIIPSVWLKYKKSRKRNSQYNDVKVKFQVIGLSSPDTVGTEIRNTLSDEKMNMADILKEENKSSLPFIRTITLVAGAHIVLALTDGATTSFGIFLTDIADELNVGLSVIGAAASLLTSVFLFFSPVGAYIATKLGCRRTIVIGTLMISVGFMLSSQVRETWQLFFSHSVVTGIGMTLTYTNVISFVGLACDKHISIANGVMISGTAAGWVIIPPLINVLREIYGWRGALLLLGAIVFHATFLSLILFRSPSKKSQPEIRIYENFKQTLDDTKCMELCCDDGDVDTKENEAGIQQNKTKVELLLEYLQLPLTYPQFGSVIIVANLTFLAFAGTFYHLVSSAIKRDIPETKATLLMTVYGIGNIISRMLHGVPIKLKVITSQNLFVIALTVAGVSTYLLPFCETYQSIVSATFCIGLSTGTCVPLVYLSTREIVGIKDFPKALGMVLSTTGLTGVIGGFFTGWIYDFSGSYNTAFFIMGFFFFTGSSIMIVPRVWLKYKQSRKHSQHNDVKVKFKVIEPSSLDIVGTAI
ncbi:uncharacterized protein LOC117105057 [Anneissia japonica]|uniref:uncharacterized protein LOC117105057 n=1 Tax=Anneissia japonica TaxID=1529436 RepID=UPI001425952A|nr:uncharacterized protein LOC117105057 [Anneissia japonica]